MLRDPTPCAATRAARRVLRGVLRFPATSTSTRAADLLPMSLLGLRDFFQRGCLLRNSGRVRGGRPARLATAKRPDSARADATQIFLLWHAGRILSADFNLLSHLLRLVPHGCILLLFSAKTIPTLHGDALLIQVLVLVHCGFCRRTHISMTYVTAHFVLDTLRAFLVAFATILGHCRRRGGSAPRLRPTEAAVRNRVSLLSRRDSGDLRSRPRLRSLSVSRPDRRRRRRCRDLSFLSSLLALVRLSERAGTTSFCSAPLAFLSSSSFFSAATAGDVGSSSNSSSSASEVDAMAPAEDRRQV